jgi:hypothetical protein
MKMASPGPRLGRLAKSFDQLQPQMYCDLLQGQPSHGGY